MATTWQNKWIIVKEILGGGQGKAYIVKHFDGDESEYFLKELIENRSERRARMHRETACYDTLSHSGIPALIDSNSADFNDEDIVPYLVTEYVPGENLHQYLQKKKVCTFLEATEIISRLLDIVGYIHSQETVHRDIKPENVIIKDKNPSHPILVDFGLSHYETEANDHITPVGQELGNRFLRLPEFRAGSSNKRDPRSDITQCAGLLFYLLTGKRPSALRDEDGLAPHQTEEGRKLLAQHKNINHYALLNIFDRAFDKIDARWSTAEQLADAITDISMNINNENDEEELSPDEMVEKINQKMKSHDEQRKARIYNALNRAITHCETAQIRLLTKLPGFVSVRGNLSKDMDTQIFTEIVGIVKELDHSSGYMPVFVSEVIGEEILLKQDSLVIYRGMIDSMENDINTIIGSIETILLRGLTAQS